MKILYVSFYFPPFNTMGGIRAGGQVRALEEAGHSVKVLSSNHQGHFPKLDLGIFDVNLYNVASSDQTAMHLRNSRKPFYQTIKGLILNSRWSSLKEVLLITKDILDSEFGIHKKWKKMILEDVQSIKDWEPEIILASYSPISSLLIGKKLSKKLNISFFAEMRDSWSFNPVVSRKKEDNYFSKILQKYESYLLRDCAGIISATDFIHQYYLSLHPSIPNQKIYGGYDSHNLQIGESKINKMGKKFVITHAGSLLQGRKSPEMLFKSISSNKKLKENYAINFFGNDQDQVILLAKKYSLQENVSCMGSIDYHDCKKSEEDSDILLMLMQNNDNEKYAVTGKVFDLIKLKKDILMIYGKKSEAEEIVVNSGLGMALENENDIKDYLLRFLSNQDKNVQANHHFIESLSRKNQISLMIGFINQNI